MSTLPESAATIHFDTTWTTAVRRVSELAQARLPEALHGRIQRATGLVLARACLWTKTATPARSAPLMASGGTAPTAVARARITSARRSICASIGLVA